MTMTNTGTVTAPLVAAIEAAWRAIQTRHQDVPEVVVTLGSGSARNGMTLGHFAPNRWARGDETVHELFVGGEGLQRGGEAVLGTLIHEAAHGAAQTRGIKDTSRQGRFHNQKFKAIGEEFGLSLEKHDSIGWSLTTVPPATAARYAAEVAMLDAALVAYRLVELGGSEGKKKTSNGVVALCDCGRKIRLSQSVLDLGPIVCGVCDAEFQPEDDGE
ncbi:hypothetical protein [Plantibacter sp. ME-Dv--P-095]|uniref:hypothetical protein n=1 Tax=Plantibacter sp. ME-Dv--P-095 TaxID=3040299 RepID=UPI00254D0FC4|nr:hypothetical protein [Plantibacter sp. ME-Dv--P-095]